MTTFPRALCAAALLVLASGAIAQVEVEKPPIALDAAAEVRYAELLPNLRCLVCQNESLADSQAPLAADLRYEIRGLLANGKSDAEIRSYLTDRYGEFVLYKPLFSARNAVLWLGPFLLALLGLVMLIFHARRLRAMSIAPKRPDEDALRRLLETEGDEGGKP